jgi:hypothetical protein
MRGKYEKEETMTRLEVFDKLNKSSRYNKFKILSQNARNVMLHSFQNNHVTDEDFALILSEIAECGKIKEKVMKAKNNAEFDKKYLLVV